MARELSWSEVVRRDTPTVEQVDWAADRQDDAALLRLLVLSNVAIAGHLDRIASERPRRSAGAFCYSMRPLRSGRTTRKMPLSLTSIGRT